MRTISRLVLAIGLLIPAVIRAQHADDNRVSVHALLGALLPTGRHRSVIGDAISIGAQVGVGLRPSLALVGDALISQPTYRVGTGGEVTMVQYDLGLEVAPRTSLSTHRRVIPFVGAGAGARSYDRDSDASGRRYVPAGYASAGGELALGRARLRVEVRDYVSRSETSGTISGVWNDVSAIAGLAYHFR